MLTSSDAPETPPSVAITVLSEANMTEDYKQGFEDAIQQAVQVIKVFEPYSPYIVGKMKIEKRKTELVAEIKALIHRKSH